MAGSTSPGRLVVPKTITGRDRSVATKRDNAGQGRGGRRGEGRGTGNILSEGKGGEHGETWRSAVRALRGQYANCGLRAGAVYTATINRSPAGGCQKT